MTFFTDKKISPSGTVNMEDLKGWALNVIAFSAPTLAVFFTLLSQGVSIEKAWPVAAISLYGAVADLFRKFSNGSK